MHEFYHRKGKTDLDAMRVEANRRLVDKYHPEETTIHYHSKEEGCEVFKHEEFRFPVPEQKDKTEEQGETVGSLNEGKPVKLDTWNDHEHDGPRL